MATKREYLVGLGLAKPGRGRFSKEANEALAAAEASGVVFDEPVVAPKVVSTEGADAPSNPPKPTSEATAIREWAAKNGIAVGNRGRIASDIVKAYQTGNATSVRSEPARVFARPAPQVRVRQERARYGKTAEGYTVGWSLCRKCAYHISFCRCASGPVAPSMIVKALDRVDTY